MSTGDRALRRVVSAGLEADAKATALHVAKLLGVGSILAGGSGAAIVALALSAPTSAMLYALIVLGAVCAWLAVSLFVGATLAAVAAASG
ncbi:MAG: hypothetical protein QXG03_09230 [Halalkalicoccus sp.]